jgi:hypothetical protein
MSVHTFMLVSMGGSPGSIEKEVGGWVQTLQLINLLTNIARWFYLVLQKKHEFWHPHSCLLYKMKIWVKRVDEPFSARQVNLTSTLCVAKRVSKILFWTNIHDDVVVFVLNMRKSYATEWVVWCHRGAALLISEVLLACTTSRILLVPCLPNTTMSTICKYPAKKIICE